LNLLLLIPCGDTILVFCLIRSKKANFFLSTIEKLMARGKNTLIKFKSSKSIKGARVNILGYPGDRCRDSPVGRIITQKELNNCTLSDWASVPWLSFEKIVDPGSDSVIFGDMIVLHDFAPGMSGSPVWLRWMGFRNLLGIANAETRGPTNLIVRFTKNALTEILSWID